MWLIYDANLVIILGYLAICLFIGLYKAKALNSLRHFAIGAQNAKAPLLVTLIFVTAVGASNTVGVVGKAYVLGIAFVAVYSVIPLGCFINAKIFANNIERFSGCLTVSQVMGKLYGKWGRWIASIFSLVISPGVVAAQAIAIGSVFHYFFHVNVVYGILLSYGLMTLYSAIGGIRSVVLTELFQFIVFFIVILAACIFYFQEVGNVEDVMAMLPDKYTKLQLDGSEFLVFAGLCLFYLLPDSSSPYIQRYLMASNSAELRRSFYIIALISVPFILALVFIAYLTKATAPDLKSAEVLFYFTEQLPTGLKGLMIAAIFAIIMSTAEAWINSAAVTAVNDIVNPLFPKLSASKQVMLARIFTVLISIISVIIALADQSIVELIWLLDSLWEPPILIPLIAGFLGFKTSSKSFIANVVTGLPFCLIGRLMAGEFGVISLLVGLLGSAVGFFGTHYWQVYHGTIHQPFPKFNFKLPAIKNPLANLPYRIKTWQEKVWREKPRYGVFAGFTLNYYFFFALFLTNSTTHQILLLLFLLGFLMSGPLLMRDIFFTKSFQERYVPFYWYFLVTFCLPMVGSFCLLASAGNALWIVNGLVFITAVFYFMNAISSIVVISTGTLLGYILFTLMHNYLGTTSETSPLLVPYVYLLILMTALLFVRHKEEYNREKIENMKALGGTIAHEVRNPIASMAMIMETVNSLINDALQGAKNKNGSYQFNLSAEDFQTLSNLNANIKTLGSRGVNTIENILLSLKTSLNESPKEMVPIKVLIAQTLKEYVMYNPAVKDIKISIARNFTVLCCPTHFKYMLFNLLKNAYKYNGNKVRIVIAAKNTTLYFTDYGKGISPNILPYIFDRFYTKSSSGTGLGLALCKMVMESLGGNISCQSKTGKYTRFSLTFPKLNRTQV